LHLRRHAAAARLTNSPMRKVSGKVHRVKR
jgi:hypothetical protein